MRFVANVDGAEIAAALAGLDPAETLVIVVSKSFTTEETLVNGDAARAWLAAALGEEGANKHLAAVSANVEGAGKFGVAKDRVFAFWDWVGGRYSLWSAVGLSTAIGLGWDVFAELLAGGAAMDEHFRSAPLEHSAPALLALAHLFGRNGLSRPIRAVVPYARRLALLPAFLQQLEMESNGKRVERGRQAAGARLGGGGVRRCWHHRPARLLPDAAPRDRRDPGRHRGGGQGRRGSGGTSDAAPGQRRRPGRGADGGPREPTGALAQLPRRPPDQLHPAGAR